MSADEGRSPHMEVPNIAPSVEASLEAALDPINGEIIARIEKYIEGQLVTDHHKRELIAAYMTGMISALDMLAPKKKQKFILLPAVLHKKVLNFAKSLGMQFEEKP
jgi:hypothetical protein